jgi:hypothetical protein
MFSLGLGRLSDWTISEYISTQLDGEPLCRKDRKQISPKLQVVLRFAGLRRAIAFALSENMPGPNKEVYATDGHVEHLHITTVACGGFTELLSRMTT